MVAHIRIGDMLVAAGFVTEAQVSEALARQQETGRRLGAELIEMGFVTEVQFTQVLSNQLSIPWVSLSHVQFTRELLNLLPASLAQAHVVVPIYIRHVRRAGDTLFVAMQDPTDETALAEVVAATNMPAKPMVAPPTEIQNAIRVYYLGTRARRAEPAPAEVAAPARKAPPKPPPKAAAKPAASENVEATPEAAAPAAASAVEPEAPLTEAAVAKSPAPQEPAEAPTEAPASKDEAWSKQARPKKQHQAQARPRMITLTLLDGTTVRLPAPGGGGGRAVEEETPASQSLTALDLVRALQARAKGEDVSNVLPDDRWELLFSTLLTLLIKKGLVADWEFVEEWQRQRGD